MDFKIEVARTDEATRTVHMRLVPDPRRYIETEIDGNPHYVDKYLRLAIPAKLMLGRCAEQAKGLPLYHLSAHIDSTPKYAAARKAALGAELQGGVYVPPSEKPAAHRELGATENKRLVFLSVDICGSSALRRAGANAFDKAFALFLRELGTVAGQFNGTILNTTGDGFIAYIDYPAFTQQCDHAIDMGLSFLVLLRDSVNPSLQGVGFHKLGIRVGADFGNASVKRLEVPSTGFSAPEVASDALNRAVKIEQSAQENEFRIGRALYEKIHVQWLERATEVPFDGNSVGVPGYKVYRVA